MILPTVRDPHLTAVRRGGTFSDEHHHHDQRVRNEICWSVVDCRGRVGGDRRIRLPGPHLGRDRW